MASTSTDPRKDLGLLGPALMVATGGWATILVLLSSTLGLGSRLLTVAFVDGPSAAGLDLQGLRAFLGVDLLLIPSYGLLLAWGNIRLLRWASFPGEGRGPGGPRLALAAAMAATLLVVALDLLENTYLHRAVALAGSAQPAMARVRLFASAKLWLLPVAGTPLLVLLVLRFRMWLRERTERRLTNPVESIDAVRRAEGQYIRDRRRFAELGPDGPLVGLAFSGGGIRSATVNLGVCQGLAKHGMMQRFDYMATVSGGGYIGACLSSLLSISASGARKAPDGHTDQFWFRRRHGPGSGYEEPLFSVADAEAFPLLHAGSHGTDDFLTSKMEMRHLRSHSSYLISRQGVFTRDVIRAVGSVLAGISYHLFITGLAMALFVSLGLWLVLGMLGSDPFAVMDACCSRVDSTLVGHVGAYLGAVFGVDAVPPGRVAGGVHWEVVYPALLGFVLFGLAAALLTGVRHGTPASWFRRPGKSVEDTRQDDEAWCMVIASLASAFVYTLTLDVAVLGSGVGRLATPATVYLGSCLGAVAAWGLSGSRVGFGRNQRSTMATWTGLFIYLLTLSVVALAVPFAVWWLSGDRVVGGFSGWAVTATLAYLLSRREGAAGQGVVALARSWIRAIPRFLGGLRRVVLGGLVAVGLLLALSLVAVLVLRVPPGLSLAPRIVFWTGGSALGLFLLGRGLDYNRLALHYFYRDRLAEAYLQTDAPAGSPGDLLRDNAEMPLTHLHGVALLDAVAQPGPGNEQASWTLASRAKRWISETDRTVREHVQTCVTSAPYHLIQACLNLTSSDDLVRKNRKSDYFLFSKLYCGSETTGFVPTREYRGGETKLARAVGTSGAAASPAMGNRTFFASSVPLTLANVRLGQWLQNPRYRRPPEGHSLFDRIRSALWESRPVFWPAYLFYELSGRSDASGELVHVSDGGHSGDNLGLAALLRRRCQIIVIMDAEMDDSFLFNSFNTAARQAYIDWGIDIDIRLDPIRPDDTGRSRARFAVGRVEYPPWGPSQDPEEGWLVLMKSCLTGSESEPVKNYHRLNPDFPHDSTGDQFFADDQFEAYRALGERTVAEVFGGPLAEIVGADDTRAWLGTLKGLWNEQRA